MTIILAQIDGRDPVSGDAVILRAASVDDDRVCHLDGQLWWPALSALPALRYDLFDGAFGAAITTPQSSMGLAIGAWPSLPALMLADARVQLWAGNIGQAWADYAPLFDGRITAQPQIANGNASLNVAVDDRWLDEPLLDTYAGTTGIEGDAALKGQPKPLALGAPRYVSGTLIDATNTVVQLSAYGEIEAVEVAMDRLARFSSSVGNYASYAALVAATIPAGNWATCRAQGLVRHGAPPEGRLSYLVRGDKAGTGGWVRKPGAVIKRIAMMRGASDRIDHDSLDALDTARPWNISVYVGEQTTARALIQQIAASVNAVAGVTWLGKLFVTPVEFGTPDTTLDASGATMPPVASVEQLEIASPFHKLAIEAEKTWSVHGLSEVAFSAVLVERGLYDPAESYREGHIVALSDGSRWLYVATTPSSGNAPADGSIYWDMLNGPTVPIYADGTPVEDLKPAAPGATPGAPDGWIIGGTLDPQTGEVVGGVEAGELVGIVEDTESGLAIVEIEVAAAEGRLDDAEGRIDAAELELSSAVLDIVDLDRARLSSEAAARQLERQTSTAADALLRTIMDARKTRVRMRDAGIVVDPADGSVNIRAVDEQGERLNAAEIRLVAQEALIQLRATSSWVLEQISLAAIDPSQIAELEDIFARLSEAEIAISGLLASIELKASTADLSALGLTVTNLGITIDALAGTITTKADTSVVTALDARVGSVESVIETLGDVSSITTTIRQVRFIAEDNAEATLKGLLAQHAANKTRRVQLAEVRTEGFARLADGLAAEAGQRLLIAADVLLNKAAIAAEQTARASGDAANATAITTLSASVTTLEGEVEAEIARLDVADATETTARAAAISGLDARLDGAEASILTVQEAIVDLEAGKAEASDLTALEVRMDGAEAGISTINLAIIDLEASKAEASSVTALSVRMDDAEAELVTVNAALVDLDEGKASVSSVTTLAARIDDAEAELVIIAAVAAEAEGIAKATWGFRMTVGNEVSGMLSENDGELSTVTFKQDVFKIVGEDGEPRTEYSDGLWKVLSGSGVAMLEWGVEEV
ncbi:hypothetical protein M9978_16385 [Sphingomonas sp. MG17]|uniref:Tip attachment protein J domain-containing protein n=1 Tax=Sphingomonas tagetis TaxID=2949092 RepID=A0A9X2HR08_9SPHN|nr:hypothetical protein [Sphingomonas tagetis]MCP3732004.1 hypothetical protein [Sphingomonas tagetis]